MTTALAITPASGAITATRTVCRVDVTGAPPNTLTGYDGTIDNTPTGQHQYPASPAVRYLLAFSLASVVRGRSYVFTPGPDEKHTFNNYIFPEAGTWTVDLVDTSDDSVAATLSVTVA